MDIAVISNMGATLPYHGQVDFAETTETAETQKWKRNTEHSKYFDATLAHVFFEAYLPVSAPVLSGTWLPQFPIKVAYSVARLVCSFIYSMSVFRSSSGKEKTCCQSRSNGREL